LTAFDTTYAIAAAAALHMLALNELVGLSCSCSCFCRHMHHSAFTSSPISSLAQAQSSRSPKIDQLAKLGWPPAQRCGGPLAVLGGPADLLPGLGRGVGACRTTVRTIDGSPRRGYIQLSPFATCCLCTMCRRRSVLRQVSSTGQMQLYFCM
jgi:hypothetical protein